MPEPKDGCVQPARGPILDNTPSATPAPEKGKEESRMQVQARVGRPAPDFEAHAYVQGEGFKPIRLSNYRGKWIVLCFYPGDFTFV